MSTIAGNDITLKCCLCLYQTVTLRKSPDPKNTPLSGGGQVSVSLLIATRLEEQMRRGGVYLVESVRLSNVQSTSDDKPTPHFGATFRVRGRRGPAPLPSSDASRCSAMACRRRRRSNRPPSPVPHWTPSWFESFRCHRETKALYGIIGTQGRERGSCRNRRHPHSFWHPFDLD